MSDCLHLENTAIVFVNPATNIENDLKNSEELLIFKLKTFFSFPFLSSSFSSVDAYSVIQLRGVTTVFLGKTKPIWGCNLPPLVEIGLILVLLMVTPLQLLFWSTLLLISNYDY